jgi:AraC-like DNA-binding protein
VDIVEILSNLVRLALSDDSDGMACPVPQEVLCERIKDYIAKNLRNPNLSVAHIAEALRYSPRYLQKAFERQGITISSYVSQARLGRCYHDLQNPLLRNESITGIAFSWGFNSSAHFSRSFREHFGVSPHIARNEGPKLYAATSA